MVLDTNGARRVEGDASIAAHRNVGDGERLLSVIGGAALAIYGLDRRGLGGSLLAIVGAELLRRGATGHCLVYDALNVSTATDATAHGVHRDLPASPAATVRASRAVKVEHSITVGRPASELYAFWRNPTNVPRVIESVESVELRGDGRAHWRARGPVGTTIEWDAEIVNDVPNEILAWKSVGDAPVPNAGSLNFRPAASGRDTEVRLVLEYEPPGGHLGAWVAKLIKENPDNQVRSALVRFKQLAEFGASPASEVEPSAS
jgi:uncharacterized membrane protein